MWKKLIIWILPWANMKDMTFYVAFGISYCAQCDIMFHTQSRLFRCCKICSQFSLFEWFVANVFCNMQMTDGNVQRKYENKDEICCLHWSDVKTRRQKAWVGEY